MQSKVKKIIYFLLIIYLLFNIVAYIRFMLIKVDNSQSDFVKESMEEAVKKGEEFSFRELTNFDWDQLYVFRPYTPKKTMEEEIGRKWSVSKTFLGYQVEKRTEILSQDDSFMVFLFVREGRVVNQVIWSRSDGDLLFLAERSPLLPEDIVRLDINIE